MHSWFMNEADTELDQRHPTLRFVQYLGGHPWRSGPPRSSACCLRPPGLSALQLWTHTGWPAGSTLTLTQLNHVNHAICSPSMPYGINRRECTPSESRWSVKKQLRLKKESNPNVKAGRYFCCLFGPAYLLPEGFLPLPVCLVWGAQRDVLVLLWERSFCQFIAEGQRWCIVKGYESACCSYSE